MTGLDFNSDRILEIAIIITDSHLNPVDDGLNLIVKQPKSVLDKSVVGVFVLLFILIFVNIVWTSGALKTIVQAV